MGILIDIRNAAIRLLAGKSTVMVNAHLSVAARSPSDDCGVHVKKMPNGFICRCHFIAAAPDLPVVFIISPVHPTKE